MVHVFRLGPLEVGARKAYALACAPVASFAHEGCFATDLGDDRARQDAARPIRGDDAHVPLGARGTWHRAPETPERLATAWAATFLGYRSLRAVGFAQTK